MNAAPTISVLLPVQYALDQALELHGSEDLVTEQLAEEADSHATPEHTTATGP
jgi:hypothetical protein